MTKFRCTCISFFSDFQKCMQIPPFLTFNEVLEYVYSNVVGDVKFADSTNCLAPGHLQRNEQKRR